MGLPGGGWLCVLSSMFVFMSVLFPLFVAGEGDGKGRPHDLTALCFDRHSRFVPSNTSSASAQARFTVRDSNGRLSDNRHLGAPICHSNRLSL